MGLKRQGSPEGDLVIRSVVPKRTYCQSFSISSGTAVKRSATSP